MAEDSGPTQSISARIAALKINELGRVPGGPPPSILRCGNTGTTHDAPPPLPGRPQVDGRRHTAHDPPVRSKEWPPKRQIGNQPIGVNENGVVHQMSSTVNGNGTSENGRPVLPPRPPPRRNTPRTSPPLPPRRPSEQTLNSKNSVDSLQSTMSTLSGTSAHSATTTLSSLEGSNSIYTNRVLNGPKAPPHVSARRPEGVDVGSKQPPRVLEPRQVPAVSMPALPPRPPARRETPASSGATASISTMTKPKRSALSFGMNPVSEVKLGIPSKPGLGAISNSCTPSVAPPPLRSASVTTTSPASQDYASNNQQKECLKCRDFSAADEHATRFPRESLPSTVTTQWLSHELTRPFPSLTDKARAIFTWLHHNIEYDVQSFFNNSVKGSTPASTLRSGLAVCEGYAGLFTALATHAGLESVVIGGHGKGYGFTPLSTNSGTTTIPPYNAGHAWNGVKLDGGRWKLIDCCWGAGHVNGPGQPYTKRFAPSFFTMDHEQFGRRHFPENPAYFFRSDGSTVSWKEYITADARGTEGPQIYSGVQDDHGLDELSFRPTLKHIPLSYPTSHHSSRTSPTNGQKEDTSTIRFQFNRVCEHWQPENMGKGKSYLYIVVIQGRSEKEEDQKDRYRAFQNDGRIWWCDIPRAELGWEKGQSIMCFAVTTINGEDARGLTFERYQEINGRVGMGFGGVAQWELT
ncbi:MAG: hypothetical protein M1823_006033 [Watsoniomyces obsoletus]|nr:MAG: hypothetical protein M1823_006033 [Watsoniomyces obsoletus]